MFKYLCVKRFAFVHIVKQVLHSHLFDLLLLAFLAVIPFWNTGIKGLILPGETSFPLDPSHFLETQGGKWAWQPVGFFGADYTQGLPFVTYYGVLAILNGIFSIPVALLQRIWSILILAFCGWSMYFLTSTIILGATRQRRIACLVSAFFYMYNPVLIAYMRAGTIGSYVFTLSMTPLFLGLLIKGLHSQRDQHIYAILLAFTSLSQVLGIQLFLDNAILPAALYFVFYIATCGSKDNAIRAFRFAGLAITFTFLINVWWIIPSAFDLIPVYTQQVGNIAERKIGHPPYLDIFRLYLGSWPFQSYYQSSLGIITGIILAVIVYSTLLMHDKRSYLGKQVIFFAILALVLSTLTAGDGPPFGSLYRFILYKVPGGVIFLPHDCGKFTTVLLIPYAFLLGAAAMYLTRLVMRVRHIGLVIKWHTIKWQTKLRPLIVAMPALAICTLIILNSNPLLTGNLGKLISPVEIPSYYYSTKNWLNEQNEEFRFFVIPSPYMLGQTKYAWAPYSMSEKLYQLPKQPVMNWPLSLLPGKDIVGLTQSRILSGNDLGVGKILGLMNVKYIMIRTDLDPKYHGQYDFEAIERKILESGEFHTGPSFGPWIFYENNWFSDMIFPAKHSFSVVGDVSSLLPLAEENYLELNSSAVFFLDDMNISDTAKALSLSDFIFIDKNELDKQLEAEILNSGLRQVYDIAPEAPQVNILREGKYLIALETRQNNRGSKLLIDGSNLYDLSRTQTIYLSAGLHDFMIGTDILGSSVITGYNGMQVEFQDSDSKHLVKGLLTSPISTIYGINFKSSESSWNLTDVESINLSVYLNNTKDSMIGLTLYDEDDNWRQWIIPMPPAKSWSEVAVQLNSPSTGSAHDIDLTRVKRLLFHIFINSPQTDSYQIMIRKVAGVSGRALLISTNSEDEQIDEVFRKQCNAATSFTKINPTLYKVRVKTSSPFILVFSNSYHLMWKVYINGKDEINPFKINSYANGYFIDKIGNYELTIEFIVQRYVAIGALISIISALAMISLVILSVDGLKRKKN